MQIMNWMEIEPAGTGAGKLDAGAYVLRITGVSEHTSRKGTPYLTFVYDIAEGKHANHFATETADYRHSFNRSYEGNAAEFFRSFLNALESSNAGRFDLAAWNKLNIDTQKYHWEKFEGLIIGVLFRDLMYTSSRTGKDATKLDFVRAMPAQDVRDGNWTVPPVKDDRDKPSVGGDGYYAAPTAKPADQGSAYDADIPF